ncbi:MAG TPA: hypothetical protein VGM30_19765 [Puia sp.]|jgi:hypothetical protein
MSLQAVIETELKVINDVPFHNLCNAILAREYRVELHSPGTATAKDKSKPGRPDAFFPLRHDKYVLAEYTTQDTNRRADFLAKLESDLKGCLDFANLGITPAQVDRIILCCNSSVSLKEFEVLNEHVRPYNIPLSIYGIKELSRFLTSEGRAIAKEYLRVAIPGGFLLMRGQFVQQYQRGHIATPLDTQWVGRPGQVAAMATLLNQKDILVVKGQPGVGKTRLVLEVIDLFVEQHPQYEAFYVLNQAQSIEEDLAINIQRGKDYVLFLDDVNQHPANLMQCITKQTQAAAACLKIVTTVRDYAKGGVIDRVQEMNFEQVTIRRMDDDAITELVFQVCPGIRHQGLLERLLTISAGNPRLALMAAQAVKESPNLQILHDAGSIYARYFDPIIRSNEIFKKSAALKAMGLIAFFYTLDLEEPEDQLILEKFGFDPGEFMDMVRALEALEFVEIHDGCVVKIAEQTMAMYFFFKVFLEDRSLPFQEILTGYFASHWWQMRDGFMPAQAIFGSEKVLNPVREALLAYYRSIRAIPEICQRFLEVFGRYFPNEVFRYLIEETQSLADATDPSFAHRRIERGMGYYDHHPMLKLLEVHFESEEKGTFEAAINLAFRLVRKVPQLYEALVRKLQQALALSSHDPVTIERLGIAFDWMEARRSDAALIQPAFYAIFGHLLLGHQIEIGFFRHDNGAVIVDPSIGQYRGRYWETLLRDFRTERELVFKQLMHYLDDEQYLRPILIQFDLPYLKRLISPELDPRDFGHCYFVNLFSIVATEKGKADADLKALCQPFQTATWKLFLLYGDDPFLGARERVGFDQYEKAQLAKEKKVRNSLKDCTANYYQQIHSALEVMSAFGESSRFTLGWANDVAISEIAKKDLAEGLKALRYYVKKGKVFTYFPTRILRQFFSAGEPWVGKSRELIEKGRFTEQFKWMEAYFTQLPDEYIHANTIQQLLKHYRNAPSGYTLFENSLDKFLVAEPKVYQKVLDVLSRKRAADEKFVFHLGYQFFQQLAGKSIPLKVCMAAYLQQQRMPGHFDSDSAQFFTLFARDNQFLRELTTFLVEESSLRFKTDYRPLGRIWNYPTAEDLVAPIFRDLLAHKEKWCCRDVAVSLFFGINAAAEKRATSFLQKMLREHPENDVLVNWVFEIAWSYLVAQYIPLMLYALRQNPDLERFKRMDLLSSSFFTTSNEIWEEVREVELRKIHKEILNDLERITYMGHLDYLMEWINLERKKANWTKRRRFRKFEH